MQCLQYVSHYKTKGNYENKPQISRILAAEIVTLGFEIPRYATDDSRYACKPSKEILNGSRSIDMNTNINNNNQTHN